MNIQPIGIDRFLVMLSSDDMSELDITYDQMDYSNIETRRVIWTILDSVRRDTGRDVDPSGNLMIEATPDNAGGCILLFTVPQIKSKNGTVIAKLQSTLIFEFNSVNDLLDAIRIVGRDSTDGKIFTDGEHYRAEFSSEKAARYRRELEEYGRPVCSDLIELAHTCEHWKELSSAQ